MPLATSDSSRRLSRVANSSDTALFPHPTKSHRKLHIQNLRNSDCAQDVPEHWAQFILIRFFPFQVKGCDCICASKAKEYLIVGKYLISCVILTKAQSDTSLKEYTQQTKFLLHIWSKLLSGLIKFVIKMVTSGHGCLRLGLSTHLSDQHL